MNENECWEALNEMKTLKSPGSDGMSTEFYIFWKDLKKILSSISKLLLYLWQINTATNTKLHYVITQSE